MIHFILFAMILTLGVIVNAATRSQINRMAFGFSEGNKPYTPSTEKPAKPKKPKDNFRHLMARAKYSGDAIVGMSGKVQGTVYLSNNVVRVWRKPNNVRNAATQFVRGLFSGTSTAWKTLTATEINSWITAAPLYFSRRVFGTAYALKGNTLFQRVNNILTSLALANVTTAPGIASPAFVITAITPAAAAGTATFTANITEFIGHLALPTGAYLKVYGTRQTDIGKSSFGLSQYRLIGVFAPGTATDPLDIESDYVARFGPLVAGQRIGLAFESIQVNGGGAGFNASGRFFTSCVVAA